MDCLRKLLWVLPAVLFASMEADGADREHGRSHPAMRPLPLPSQRPLSDGPARYVSPTGDDQHNGSQARPWRTLALALEKLEAGQTLYLRGGVYHGSVVVRVRGTASQPVTIRSFPGELAIIDGGLREFQDNPAAAWEPCPDGVEGEFRSTRTYPDLGGGPGQTNLLGRFVDSMIPLHGYRYVTDLRSDNEYFSKLGAGKTEAGTGIYCGPGLYFDTVTSRIHVRLAHTRQLALEANNYRGETDPRNMPLVISGPSAGSPLTIQGARYLRLQDLVVRGARDATINIDNAANIELDGLTVYGGASCIRAMDTLGLRVLNTACRGIAAPWTFRGSLKYRAIEARLFTASGWSPTGVDNRNFELAYSEFTDSVDGVFIGNVHGVKFHHNLLDNVSDDGIFLTAGSAFDGSVPGGDVQIYQNLLSRCLTTFAFGVGHGRQKTIPGGKQTGSGVFIFRNVFDFRQPVLYQQPGDGDEELSSWGRVAGDHGSPAWEPMTIYQNTILSYDPPFRGYYLAGLGGHMGPGARRRLFNNIVTQVEGRPGHVLPEVPADEAQVANAKLPKKEADPLDDLLDSATEKPRPAPKRGKEPLPRPEKLPNEPQKSKPVPLPIDFQADGNLHWSFGGGKAETSDAEAVLSVNALLGRFQRSPGFQASQRQYPAGWTSHDQVADPKFVEFGTAAHTPVDARLKPGSPAVDAGVPLPADWPDTVRDADRGPPDIGAFPLHAAAWRVGIHGRLTASGAPATGGFESIAFDDFPVDAASVPDIRPRAPAAIVEGYPAFDSPLLQFALRRQRIPVEVRERAWLDTSEYARYGLVVLVGDMARGNVEPRSYSKADLPRVKAFLEKGGTLLLMRGTANVFTGADGLQFIAALLGTAPRSTAPVQTVPHPEHAWVKHLDPDTPHEWMTSKNIVPLIAGRGERVLLAPSGQPFLYRLQVGQGQLIYIGWEIASSLPAGRSASSVEQEQSFAEQMQILLNVLGE